MDADRRIVDAEEVPEAGTVLVTLRPLDEEAVDEEEGDVGAAEDGTTEAEAILVRIDDVVRAYRNYCQHWTDIRLDKGDGAFVRDEEVFCQKHGATFEAETGYCNFGPCKGSVLEAVDIKVNDGAVYLVDEDYAFVRVGAANLPENMSDTRMDFTGN